jgi:hypothetical protein
MNAQTNKIYLISSQNTPDRMPTLIRKIVLLLVLGLSTIPGFAQPKLTLASAVANPDSIQYNGASYHIVYTVVVENIGNAKLDGPVDIIMRYNSDTIDHLMTSFAVSDFEVGMQYQVSYTDTVWNISGNRYKGGDNVLVIWPHADNPNVAIPDTSNVPVYIQDIRNGTPEQSAILNSRVQVYPNPLGEQLNFRFVKDQNKLEYVRITTLEGKLIYFSKHAIQSIPMGDLPSGTLLLELKYTDGVRGTLKLTHL